MATDRFDAWCTEFTRLVQSERERLAERKNPALELERLWWAIDSHRNGSQRWDEMLPEDLVPAAERLDALINLGTLELPDRLADLEAFAMQSLCADAQRSGF
jgi:hypothetical protein